MAPTRKFDLSICIPTYNRIASLQPLVKRILTCSDPGIEVVVLDNGSTDRTLESLRSISDDRLKVHSNGTNRGVLFNILNVLDKAQGRYAVLLLDKDDVDPSTLPRFKTFLAGESDLACGYCEYGSRHPDEAILFEPGMHALRGIAYSGHHPTGYFFDTTRLRKLDYLQRFADFERVGHFPFEFIFAELLLEGRGAIYHRSVFSPEPEVNAASYKSIGTNASRENAFFSPPGRLKTAVRFCQHIGTLPLAEADKRALVVDRFLQGLVTSTLGYRSLLANAALCSHYHIAPRRISSAEMFATGLRFCREFSSQAVTAATLGTDQMPKTKFNLAVGARISKALARRLGLRSAVAAGVR
jgi:glycosyltransferase involved in cell wall biosynthesis